MGLFIIMALGATIVLIAFIMDLVSARAHRKWVHAHQIACAARAAAYRAERAAAYRAERKAAWEAAEEALDGIKWKLNWGIPPEEVFAEVEEAIAAAAALGSDTKILEKELGWWRELPTRK